MTFSFRPAKEFTDRHGVFVSLTGGTNSGKTYSALRLARGIAGPEGKIAVIDTEGGRTLNLRDQFDFDVALMDPPFRPHLFAEAAKAVEDAKYDACLIDSFSMEWTGIGGVLDWHEEELTATVERAKQRNDQRSEYAIREAAKMAAWIKPKGEHKAMVYSFLQRRIPIIFAIRGEETVKPGEGKGDKPTKIFKSICSPTFPFEVTVSFRLDSGRRGFIDLSDPKSWKMEAAHQAIFRDGDQLSEEHGAALARWARGEGGAVSKPKATLSDWIATTLPGFVAECATAADLDKLTASRVYVAALGKADDAQKAEMGALIEGARGKIEADALTANLPGLKTDADVVAWRISATVKDAMGKMSDEARALVEGAIEGRRGELNDAQGGLV